MKNPLIVEHNIRLRDTQIVFRTIKDSPPDHDVKQILEGATYPAIDFITTARTIVDIGPGAGASTIFFLYCHPGAKIFAFEPRPELFTLLRENLGPSRLIQTFNFGLFDRDCQATMGSRSVELKDASTVLNAQQIGEIDILKIDAEGAEVPILRSMGTEFIRRTRSIHVQFHDAADRLAIDDMLKGTHLILSSRIHHPHRGNLCYVNISSLPSPTAIDSMKLRITPNPETPARRIFEPSIPLFTSTNPGSVQTQPRPAEPLVNAATRDAIKTFPAHGPATRQFEVAVVMPTILRPTILQAARSIFDQDIVGRGQFLIGIDKSTDRSTLDQILAMKPDNWAVSIFDPGYSTSVRNGGLYASVDGGALRTILSYAAHSRYVAYLDDDNWWAKDHLSSLLKTIVTCHWAYSLRWYADNTTGVPICTDIWESVGIGVGIYREKFGGFVDPCTLMIDKTVCDDALRCWCIPALNNSLGVGSDRTVFAALRDRYKSAGTGKPTAFYRIQPSDPMHVQRLAFIETARRAQR